MSDLVGTPEDRFSRVAAQSNTLYFPHLFLTSTNIHTYYMFIIDKCLKSTDCRCVVQRKHIFCFYCFLAVVLVGLQNNNLKDKIELQQYEPPHDKIKLLQYVIIMIKQL